MRGSRKRDGAWFWKFRAQCLQCHSGVNEQLISLPPQNSQYGGNYG